MSVCVFAFPRSHLCCSPVLSLLLLLASLQLAHQVLSLALVLCSAVMIWKGLIVASGSETPVVVVLSGSMEPAIWRGDILFLWHDSTAPYQIGEIIVYAIAGRQIPIIHRVLEVRQDAPRAPGERGKIWLLTKGDNNPTEDRALYNPDGPRHISEGGSKLWLEESEVLGRAKGFLPRVGMLTIYLTDYPAAKFILIAVLGLFVLTSKE